MAKAKSAKKSVARNPGAEASKKAAERGDVQLVSDAKPETRAEGFSLSPDQIEAIARGASDTFQHMVGREHHAPNRQLGRAQALLDGKKILPTGDRVEKAETELYTAVVKALLPYRE
jgi:hypothetical protein